MMGDNTQYSYPGTLRQTGEEQNYAKAEREDDLPSTFPQPREFIYYSADDCLHHCELPTRKKIKIYIGHIVDNNSM